MSLSQSLLLFSALDFFMHPQDPPLRRWSRRSWALKVRISWNKLKNSERKMGTSWFRDWLSVNWGFRPRNTSVQRFLPCPSASGENATISRLLAWWTHKLTADSFAVLRKPPTTGIFTWTWRLLMFAAWDGLARQSWRVQAWISV